jgi:hypothetical protein
MSFVQRLHEYLPRVALHIELDRRSRVVRLARLLVLALVVALGINHVWWSVADWHLSDMNAYWDAALRIRQGEALFPAVSDLTASEVYRYSPWFAWVWVPATSLPRELANVLWSIVLVTASTAAVWPLARRGAWLLVAFFWPILIGISAIGNAHALLIAALVLGVERRSGPLWIAVAASLKLVPVLLVLTYLGRRQWRRSLLALGLTGLLVAPFLLYDLSNYVTDPGEAALLYRWIPLYVSAVGVSVLAALWLARSPFGWLASSVTVMLALPRSFLFDVTYLAISLPARDPGESAPESAASRG